MALSRSLIVFPLIATILSTITLAKDFKVGDEHGWTISFDYQAWAADKVFRVGDTLTFDYSSEEHNVIRVNGSDFKRCSVPAKTPVLTSGHDKILLTTTVRRWYICGATGHCQSGQKLVITVLPSQDQTWSPAPSPSSSPSPSPFSAMPGNDEVPSPTPSAPWTTASFNHFGRSLPLPKKLKKFVQRKLIAV